MAITILTDAYISINGVVLSDHSNRVKVTDNREEKDVTAFGATNKTVAKGLGDATIEVQMYQDFAAGKTYATLQPLIASTTPVAVEVRSTSAARSATNPAFVMQSLLMDFNPLDGDVGEPSMTTATFRNGSQSGMSYLTA